MSDKSESQKSENYKDTLNLPNTAFPMKANLSTREPEILKKWQELNLYQKVCDKTKNNPKFILHDGPPYANGSIHIGHGLNIILKDMVIKSKFLSGYFTPFVPGWDCHGLPIELNVEKKVGKAGDKIDAKTFRKKCREYAESQIDIQRRDFVRLGVLGDWDHPYKTMDPQYEADTVRTLAKIVENGHVIKGYKPVHWCIDCGSALAEAEVEYRNKTSPSIDVKFKVLDKNTLPDSYKSALKAKGIPENQAVSVVIWTTTPWTLPANEAVAVHPEHRYELVKIPKISNEQNRDNDSFEIVILVSELVSSVMKRFGVEEFEALAACDGKSLQGIRLQHPFYDKQVPIVLGDHVTLDAGTGAVHTAPAHGQDDFIVGEKYNLPLENPVQDNGCYVPDLPLFGGEFVLKANDKIIELLQDRGQLLHFEKLEHSYPHCWRHKTALIFRATQQWFISMEKERLRKNALDAIQKVTWIPTWGQGRLEGMLREGRPDWCISRQRTWGVPLCFFTHRKTGELHPNTPHLMEEVAKRIEKLDIDAWYDLPIEDFLGPDEAKDYEKSFHTLDVWFDAGSSHFSVLERRKELAFPADLYLEGSDQHRGWFLSSLLTAVAMKEQAPYKQVLTHGFMTDADGYKMSKSLGNVLAPEKVVNSLGADVMRLWVSGVDYQGEVAVSEEILKRSGDIYRRIRNTARFLLANLNGFDPALHQVPADKMLALDRFIVHRAMELQEEIITAFNNYHFHLVHQKIHNFCSIDLGSFYLDIIKDRQYTGKTAGVPRRSAQTALYHIAEALVRWMAPILSFTAEEIWHFMPGKREESVFLAAWYGEFPKIALEENMSDSFWQQILEVRDLVNKALEDARAQGKIGSGLEAIVDLYCGEKLYGLLSQLEDELRFVLITSEAHIHPIKDRPSDARETGNPELWLVVKSSSYEKCVRCWHRQQDVNADPHYPGICGRCVVNVKEGNGEIRLFA